MTIPQEKTAENYGYPSNDAKPKQDLSDCVSLPPFPEGSCIESNTIVLCAVCVEGNYDLGWINASELTAGNNSKRETKPCGCSDEIARARKVLLELAENKLLPADIRVQAALGLTK